MSSDSSSAYVNVAAPGATASFPDESTLTEKDIGQPIQKISKKKIVENKSGPISPSSPATPLECCLCGYPGCKGREAYENLVNKPLDVPAISLPVDSERRAHQISSTPPPPSPQFPGPRRCCSIM